MHQVRGLLSSRPICLHRRTAGNRTGRYLPAQRRPWSRRARTTRSELFVHTALISNRHVQVPGAAAMR